MGGQLPQTEIPLFYVGGIRSLCTPLPEREGSMVTTMTPGDAATRRALEQFIRYVELVQHSLRRNMPIQTLRVLLEIAHRPGSTPTEIAQRLGMSVSAAARNVSLLEKHARWTKQDGPERRGFDLIRIETDPTDWKRKLCYLNEAGEKLVARLLEVK
jgi:DNA-binding MarR family transcriptional regulator